MSADRLSSCQTLAGGCERVAMESRNASGERSAERLQEIQARIEAR